jgi:hypothetical protein
MKQEEIDAMLARFNGGPGVTKGLSHEETIALFQSLIDNGQIYNNPDWCAWAEAYSEPGWVTGYDKTRAADCEK